MALSDDIKSALEESSRRNFLRFKNGSSDKEKSLERSVEKLIEQEVKDRQVLSSFITKQNTLANSSYKVLVDTNKTIKSMSSEISKLVRSIPNLSRNSGNNNPRGGLSEFLGGMGESRNVADTIFRVMRHIDQNIQVSQFASGNMFGGGNQNINTIMKQLSGDIRSQIGSLSSSLENITKDQSDTLSNAGKGLSNRLRDIDDNLDKKFKELGKRLKTINRSVKNAPLAQQQQSQVNLKNVEDSLDDINTLLKDLYTVAGESKKFLKDLQTDSKSAFSDIGKILQEQLAANNALNNIKTDIASASTDIKDIKTTQATMAANIDAAKTSLDSIDKHSENISINTKRVTDWQDDFSNLFGKVVKVIEENKLTSEESLKELKSLTASNGYLDSIKENTDSAAKQLMSIIEFLTNPTTPPAQIGTIDNTPKEFNEELKTLVSIMGEELAQKIAAGIREAAQIEELKNSIEQLSNLSSESTAAVINLVEALKRANGFRHGGIIKEGTGKYSDDVIIKASKGEAIINAKGVDMIGEDNVHRINKGELPKFATGGFPQNTPGGKRIDRPSTPSQRAKENNSTTNGLLEQGNKTARTTLIGLLHTSRKQQKLIEQSNKLLEQGNKTARTTLIGLLHTSRKQQKLLEQGNKTARTTLMGLLHTSKKQRELLEQGNKTARTTLMGLLHTSKKQRELLEQGNKTARTTLIGMLRSFDIQKKALANLSTNVQSSKKSKNNKEEKDPKNKKGPWWDYKKTDTYKLYEELFGRKKSKKKSKKNTDKEENGASEEKSVTIKEPSLSPIAQTKPNDSNIDRKGRAEPSLSPIAQTNPNESSNAAEASVLDPLMNFAIDSVIPESDIQRSKKLKPAKESFGTKMKGNLGRAGLLGLVGAGLNMGGDALKENGYETAGGAVDTLGYAAQGAALGSLIGPWGTAIGGVAGGAYGLYKNWDSVNPFDMSASTEIESKTGNYESIFGKETADRVADVTEKVADTTRQEEISMMANQGNTIVNNINNSKVNNLSSGAPMQSMPVYMSEPTIMNIRRENYMTTLIQMA